MTAPQEKQRTLYNEAIEYIEQGICVIPIRPDTKRPCVKWREYQERFPTEEEVEFWFEQWPDAQIAILTGHISGYYVVDCDNEEAISVAEDIGMVSPIQVRTKRGVHYYFKCPDDGVRRGPKAGNVGRDWPRVSGLDFRGDGGYALLPPSKNYEWYAPHGIGLEDAPVWKDWKPILSDCKFENLDELDLTTVRSGSFVSEWEKTEQYIKECGFKGGKIPTGEGNARNERVMRYASEMVMCGYFGEELRTKVSAFMEKFFDAHLNQTELEATCRSVEEMERRNHPDRFNDKGEYIFQHPYLTSNIKEQTDEEPERKDYPIIFSGDAKSLISKATTVPFFIEPWLRPSSITQVYGYSGHGKSLFVQHAMYALCSGAKYFGPFEIFRPARVLYLDFENGQRTIGERLQDLRKIYGDTGDRLGVWAASCDPHNDINLNSQTGLDHLKALLMQHQPDVVVLDTLRTAYPGFKENDSHEWSKINDLCIKLRNRGLAVIQLHHSTKPQKDSGSSESGSTNQLTPLETQIRIRQVVQDEERAQTIKAKWDGSYPTSKMLSLMNKMDRDMTLDMVMEVTYGKIRDLTDEHDFEQFIGICSHMTDDTKAQIVSSMSTKQRAKHLALEGHSPLDIAKTLGKPLRTVNRWLSL